MADADERRDEEPRSDERRREERLDDRASERDDYRRDRDRRSDRDRHRRHDRDYRRDRDRRDAYYDRRRSRSRSRDRDRRRRDEREPAYDKSAVQAALSRARACPGWLRGWAGCPLRRRPCRPAEHCAAAAAAPTRCSPRWVSAHSPVLACPPPPPPPDWAGTSAAALAGAQGDASVTTSVAEQGPRAAAMAAQAAGAGGQKGARDFSFLVTEDEQEEGPNVNFLDDGDDSDSDDSGGSGDEGGEGGGEGGDDESGFDGGSAIDQLLWRQKAVSGMETRRPGESVQQFMQRRVAGMRMLKAEAGGAEAKALENEVDQAIMNANTAFHWSQGNHVADLSDEETDAEKGPLALEDKGTLMLTWDPTSGAPPPPPPEGQSEAVVASGSGAGGALVKFDANAARRREVIGNQAVRAAAALVPRAAKDALANHKTPEIESGRGFALLEKMGWKKGEGLGRTRSGTTKPVEAIIKGDMGGLAVEGEEAYGGAVREMTADGPGLSTAAFTGRRRDDGGGGEGEHDGLGVLVDRLADQKRADQRRDRRIAAGLCPPRRRPPRPRRRQRRRRPPRMAGAGRPCRPARRPAHPPRRCRRRPPRRPPRRCRRRPPRRRRRRRGRRPARRRCRRPPARRRRRYGYPGMPPPHGYPGMAPPAYGCPTRRPRPPTPARAAARLPRLPAVPDTRCPGTRRAARRVPAAAAVRRAQK